jgi:hypothetical protein
MDKIRKKRDESAILNDHLLFNSDPKSSDQKKHAIFLPFQDKRDAHTLLYKLFNFELFNRIEAIG